MSMRSQIRQSCQSNVSKDRKRVTKSKVVSLKESEMDDLAGVLGHGIREQQQYYKCLKKQYRWGQKARSNQVGARTAVGF